MTYKFYVSDSGQSVPGLDPIWVGLKKVQDGVEVTHPAITEVDYGWYKFTWSGSDVLVGVIDAGENLADIDRFIPVDLGPEDSFLSLIKLKTDSLPSGIHRNQDLNNFEFLMVSTVDHVTAKPRLHVTASRSIDGSGFSPCVHMVTEVGSGIYKIDLAAADLNGVVITFIFEAPLADARILTVVTSE
jgi:hypothetical protein